MNEGKKKVLEMLEAGKITEEEARRLLTALGEPADLNAEPEDQEREEADWEREEARREAEEAEREREEARREAEEAKREREEARREAEEAEREREEARREAEEEAERAREEARREAEEAAEQVRNAQRDAKEKGSVLKLTLYPDETKTMEHLGEDIDKVVEQAMEADEEIGDFTVPPTPPVPPQTVMQSAMPKDDLHLSHAVPKGDPYRYACPVGEIRSLNVEWMSGSVEVRPGESEELKITEYSKYPLSSRERLTLALIGGELKIGWSESHFRWPFRNHEKQLVVELPRSMAPLDRIEVAAISGGISCAGLTVDKMYLHTVSGDISVGYLQGTRVKLSSTSGRVELRNVVAGTLEANSVSGKVTGDFSAGAASVHSTSGKVSVQGSTQADLKISSVSGTVELEGAVCGELKANTTSGTLSLALDALPESIRCTSVSGKAMLCLPDDPQGFRAEYNTVSGGFQCNFPAEILKQEKRAGAVRYGQGKTQIRLSTTSGGMTIAKR